MDNTVVVVASVVTAVASVLGVVLTRFLRRNRWKRLCSKDVPLWLVHRLYRAHFPGKVRQSRVRYPFRGSYYEYAVVVKDSLVEESDAAVRHLIVRRRRRRDR